MAASPELPIEAPLKLLFFIDKRPNSEEQIQQIYGHLKDLRAEYAFELQVIDVGEQPYLAEHFRLVATPTLIKIHPEPRQTLAGSNLVSQLQNWWPRWRSAEELTAQSLNEIEAIDTLPTAAIPKETDDQASVEESHQPPAPESVSTETNSIAYSLKLIQLTEQIFSLKQENEDLREQLQFKDRIIAMLAHDLRNPLTAASIAVETLELGNATANQPSRLTPALTAQLLKHARTQTRAMDRMITDILQAARGTHTELRVHLRATDLGELCQRILSSMTDQFTAKSQSIVTDIPQDLPLVYADPDRIQQALTNLLDNASKYTSENGKIEVVMLHRTTQKIQVSVSDNGSGIPEENLERIFEDRFRLQRDESQKGYGIGLSVCQGIIRAHYGQIWVDSVLNQGSCFHFTLPVYHP